MPLTEAGATQHGIQQRARVAPAQYEPLMSEYLRCGKRLEQWHLNWIDWDGEVLSASARLQDFAVSPTDSSRFHLSIYSAREMEGQLAIVGLHLRLGLERKTAEVWLIKCTEECVAPITNPDDVRFEMQFQLRRSKSGKIVSRRMSLISDAGGGCIRLDALSLMPWHQGLGEASVAMLDT